MCTLQQCKTIGQSQGSDRARRKRNGFITLGATHAQTIDTVVIFAFMKLD